MKIRNFKDLCIEITNRETRRGADLNITQVSGTMKLAFDIFAEMGLADATVLVHNEIKRRRGEMK